MALESKRENDELKICVKCKMCLTHVTQYSKIEYRFPYSRGLHYREIWNLRVAKPSILAEIRLKLYFSLVIRVISLFSGPRIVKTENSKTTNNEGRLYNHIKSIDTTKSFFSPTLSVTSFMDIPSGKNINLNEVSSRFICYTFWTKFQLYNE